VTSGLEPMARVYGMEDVSLGNQRPFGLRSPAETKVHHRDRHEGQLSVGVPELELDARRATDIRWHLHYRFGFFFGRS